MEEMLSVGIDIGTTTTQVIFSRLWANNTSSYFSVPKVEITGKEVVYKSGIHLTPLLDGHLIDGDGVAALAAEEFRRAGFTPADTRTGAVMITGESARKENARTVLEKLSSFAGDFVVSTAGPDLESIVAGKGSGAQQYSQDHRCCVANLDIGGGTTNIAVFDNGDTVATGCYDIGGRLVRVRDGLVCTASPAAQMVAGSMGVPLVAGGPARAEVLAGLCSRMAGVLEEAMGIKAKTPLEQALRTAGSSSLSLPRRPDAICFSGGVADCIFNPPQQDYPYGDIGALLGRAISKSALVSQGRVFRPNETIRATVIGAGTCTTSVSGSTIAYDANLLPLKNIPCLKLTQRQEEDLFGGRGAFLEQELRWFAAQSDSPAVVLSLQGVKNPGYSQLKQVAEEIVSAWGCAMPADAPVLVALERDIGKALGQMLQDKAAPGRAVICIDSVRAGAGDYLDFGRPIANGLAIPIVVKTLLFGS